MVHELAQDGSVVKFTSRSLPFEADIQVSCYGCCHLEQIDTH